jgi:hypothetical protein
MRHELPPVRSAAYAETLGRDSSVKQAADFKAELVVVVQSQESIAKQVAHFRICERDRGHKSRLVFGTCAPRKCLRAANI